MDLYLDFDHNSRRRRRGRRRGRRNRSKAPFVIGVIILLVIMWQEVYLLEEKYGLQAAESRRGQKTCRGKKSRHSHDPGRIIDMIAKRLETGSL